MLPVFNTRIWFYRQPVDFRKQMNGLILLIADRLGKDPGNGDVYVFRSRKASVIRMVFWQNGFWMCQKKMEDQRFRFPSVSDEQVILTPGQFQWLLSGVSILKAPPVSSPPGRYF